MEPLQLKFKRNGKFPNSDHPLLIYKNVFSEEKTDADYMINHFMNYNWSNSWTGSVFDYHHYHSNTHEVLGVYKGFATLQFGGENGEQVSVEEGDVVVIPAGVAHKKISSSLDFAVVGAYPDGSDYDLMKENDDLAKADAQIANVSLPDNDPVYGKMEGLVSLWK